MRIFNDHKKNVRVHSAFGGVIMILFLIIGGFGCTYFIADIAHDFWQNNSMAGPKMVDNISVNTLQPYPLRTLHLKVVVNSAFASHAFWQRDIRMLIEDINKTFKSWVNVTFIIDDIIIWNIVESPRYGEYFPWDCLGKDIRKGPSDAVVYFSDESRAANFLTGISRYEQGHLVVYDVRPTNKMAAYRELYFSLIRELGHMLGAVRTYSSRDEPTFMNPALLKEFETILKKTPSSFDPVFHKANVTIFKVISRRPFSRTGGYPLNWNFIADVYGSMRETYSPWQLEGNAIITNHALDELYEGDCLAFASLWAQSFQKDSIALAYTDSLENLMSSIKHTCVRGGKAGNTKICKECTYYERTASQWLEEQKAALQYRRALIHYRANRETKADALFNDFISSLPSDLLPFRDKYTNGYAYYKEFYGKGGE
jgi:hypothetical protein